MRLRQASELSFIETGSSHSPQIIGCSPNDSADIGVSPHSPYDRIDHPRTVSSNHRDNRLPRQRPYPEWGSASLRWHAYETAAVTLPKRQLL
jgi:hypothetical protein